MPSEQYLTHPMFGLLYLVCAADDDSALYSTLYTQQLFFRVTSSQSLSFEPLGREQARRIVENRVKWLRMHGNSEELNRLLQFQRHYF
jgi:PII interaction protein X